MTAARIHSTAVVDEGAVIGEGTSVWHFCHIMRRAQIGRNCNLGQNVFIDSDVIVGDRCKFQNNVSVYKGVTIEDGVFCGPSSVFTNVINPRAEVERKDEFLPTFVRRGVTIGANATIVCGVTLGEYAFVAAGATVTKDVAPYHVVAGCPATPIGYACVCGEILRDPKGVAACGRCGRKYVLEGEALRPDE